MAWRAYCAIVSARFRMLLQYRAAALAGFGTQLFWGLIRAMIFEAFYRSTTAPQPMTYPEVVNYVWLGQALLMFLPWSGDREVQAMIRSGNVAYELLRPLDLYTLWFSRAVANRTAPVVLRALPLFTIAWLFFGLQLPPSLASAAAWALATFGALLLSCAVSTLITLSLFWTISGEGVAALMSVAVMLFSGMTVPLPLFPDRMQAILNFLPFRGLVDVPFRLYMGHIPPEGAFPLFAHQIAWTGVLVAVGHWLVARGARRLVVQGG